ncbi:hypothetical protein ED733_001494 [Metarhizium rileyi]|uniref:AB hydrolase-1 domain-containing protein n=1 Tax=Metarhizium rileyi (strain RCEF 4871) TaxID=1649241 RepID=A0A5C6G4A4_METRR|nr:hypothetical protein ED733_001494 [Metarhizium rileyi]
MANATGREIALDEETLDDFLADPRFSRTFELPADEAQGRSRMTRVALDKLAQEHKVRIIDPDRPGFGKTTDAEPQARIAFWTDAVMALLKHLDIPHVSIGTQSGGTVYALDLVLHHPEILHPERPYVGIGAPWIHPSQSGSLAMSITQSLPKALIAQTGKLASLVATVSAPMVSTSFGISDFLIGLVGAESPAEQAAASEADRQVLFEDALQPRMIKFVYRESVHGLSQDAIVLMKRIESGSGWSDWGDYDTLVPRLADVLRCRGQRLVVEVFLGETDFMVGDAGSKGPEWFNQCWKAVSDADDSPIDYSCTVVKGSDHNTTWNLRWGIPERVFRRLGETAAQ